MKTLKPFLIAILAIFAVSCSYSVKSPDNGLVAEVDGQDFTVLHDGRTTFGTVHMGLIAENGDFDTDLKLKKVSPMRIVTDDYTMPAGKRSHCYNKAYERTYTYVNPEGKKLAVIVRLYNDGFAFRYVTPSGVVVTEEKTWFSVAEGVHRWISPYDSGYEQPFPHTTTGASLEGRKWFRAPEGEWGFPALIEPQSGLFALITDSDLRQGDSGARLVNADDKEKYVVTLTAPAAFNSGMSPWRVAIIGELSDIVESTLVTDLATPSQIADTDWIKPGVSSWIYWAYNHGSKNYDIITDYIDLAAEMGWPYCLVDWEWPQMENGKTIDDVMAYANAKGIGINLWYNSGTSWVGDGAPQPEDLLNTAKSREKEMAWLEGIGAKGIKVDFFSPDAPDMVNYYLDILADAAQHHLTVDFHGSTIPNGWQRTWPNMLSMEGIYGAEWYNNGPFFTPVAASHNATIPYTRNVVGPMDYTPATFTDSQFPHITTNAHELALPVLYESGLQHMADRPEGYRSLPQEAQDVLKTLPAKWDDIKLLAGYPGESAIIARRSGSTWYIGGINGLDEPVSLVFTLERLGIKGQWSSILFCDGSEDREIRVTELHKDEYISIPCRARGGFMARIETE